jgi:DegV family protein with EDD domain
VEQVRIVTDNACDLPDDVAAAAGIVVVPLDVRLGELSGNDMRGISGARFWELAERSPELAETSAPSPGAFAEAFEQAARSGCAGAVCITLSSRLSATYQAALAGAEAFGGGFPVEVVDSLTVTMGEGLLVLEAAEMAGQGADTKVIADSLSAARQRVHVLGTLDTLEWLRRGGRIGAARALLGSLLSIKPVIEVRDGVVEPESRQRTRGRSFEYLTDKVAGWRPIKRLSIVHAAAGDVDQLEKLIAPLFPPEETIVGYIGPVVGAHTGPGTVGVALLSR